MKSKNINLNNKGFMLVEVIVASVIALIVAYFLIEITIKMVSKNNDFYIKTVLEADRNVITKEIMDDFMSEDSTVTEVKCNKDLNGQCISATISFSDKPDKTLRIYEDQDQGATFFEYGDYRKKIDKTLNIGDLNIYAEENTLYFNLPAYISYSDENYGLNIAIKYDPTITEIKVPKIEIKTEQPDPNNSENYEIIENKTNFQCTKNVENYTFSPNTEYVLETWGAEGGSASNNGNGVVYGGKGGYSQGTLNVTEEKNAFIHVGCKGKDGTTVNSPGNFLSGGYNGGGNSGEKFGGSGGGATDIRIEKDDLYYRVIVAGGGGGAAWASYTDNTVNITYNYEGGNGGGIVGEDGGSIYKFTKSNSYKNYAAFGGSINQGGKEGYNVYTNPPIAGGYGTGGNASTTYTGLYGSAGCHNYSGGGGAGWYGGGGGGVPNSCEETDLMYISAGGGGSGWVYTSDNYRNWQSGNAADAGKWTIPTDYYLTDIENRSGSESFESSDGSTETGHSGDGFVRITSKKKEYLVPILENLTDIEIKNKDEYDLENNIKIVCPKNSTCSITNYKIEGQSTLKTNELSNGEYKIIYYVMEQKTTGERIKYPFYRNLKVSEDVVYNFEYDTINNNGTYKKILSPGKYKLEVWGAQGGTYNTSYTGGKGGYSYGELVINTPTNVYVYIGEQPSGYNDTATENNMNKGGFNGGGSGRTYCYSATCTYALGGGGATDIRINEDSLYNRVIVAGGGSGATNKTDGYYGGGTTSNGSSRYCYTESGEQGGCTAGQYFAGTGGGFGGGGSSLGEFSNYYGSAGAGGGWYGGGSSAMSDSSYTSYRTGSGGGSGWVYDAETYSDWQSGNATDANNYKLDSVYYLTNTSILTGNQSFTSPSGTTEAGHSGHGYARITRIS